MKPQSGMAMVETLLAASLLALGLLGASGLTLRTLALAQQTSHQEQAQMLAKDALDCLVQPGTICPAEPTASRTSTVQGVDYTVQSQVRPLAYGLAEVSVQVTWRSRLGPQQLTWTTRHLVWPSPSSTSSTFPTQRLGVSLP